MFGLPSVGARRGREGGGENGGRSDGVLSHRTKRPVGGRYEKICPLQVKRRGGAGEERTRGGEKDKRKGV